MKNFGNSEKFFAFNMMQGRSIVIDRKDREVGKSGTDILVHIERNDVFMLDVNAVTSFHVGMTGDLYLITADLLDLEKWAKESRTSDPMIKTLLHLIKKIRKEEGI